MLLKDRLAEAGCGTMGVTTPVVAYDIPDGKLSVGDHLAIAAQQNAVGIWRYVTGGDVPDDATHLFETLMNGRMFAFDRESGEIKGEIQFTDGQRQAACDSITR